MLGSLLTWMNDHTSEVFIICTSNDISLLPPEFTRAERFDGIFFLDLPDRDQKDMIWDIYIGYYSKLGLAPNLKKPDDENWTGAEIKSACRLATLHACTLEEAAKYIVPVYKTSQEKINRLRAWATNRTLSADYVGTYDQNGPKQLATAADVARPRRRVTRMPSGS